MRKKKSALHPPLAYVSGLPFFEKYWNRTKPGALGTRVDLVRMAA